MGEIIGVISIKGGVGKTTTVVNLATVLTKEFGKKVLIVDANFSAPNLGLHLGIIQPEQTIHDVLLDKIGIEHAIIEHKIGFHVIPASLTNKPVRTYKLKQKLAPLKEHYDTIIIDSSPNLNDEILATMTASDKLLVVTSPDYPTLSCTMHAVKVAKDRNTPITGLILNKVHNKEFELTIEEIEDATNVPVIASIPDDIKVLEALSKTTPAAEHNPKRDVAIEYTQLAASIIGIKYNDTRVFANIKKYFSKDLNKIDINRTLLREGKQQN